MLRAIEARAGAPIRDCFDLIVGTSIGGCGAIHLSLFDDGVERFGAMMEAMRRDVMAHSKLTRLLTHGQKVM